MHKQSAQGISVLKTLSLAKGLSSPTSVLSHEDNPENMHVTVQFPSTCLYRSHAWESDTALGECRKAFLYALLCLVSENME